MINPSEINLSSLPWLPLDTKSAFPKNPAIYFAIDSQGTVQYIGRSLNPKNRWASHHKYEQLQAIGGIKIVYLFVDSGELLPEIELALISWFNPPLNVVGKDINTFGSTNDARNIKSTVRFRLAEVRKLRGMSQNQLAQSVGMTLQNIQHLERKAKSVPFVTLNVLCNSLKCTPADLIEYAPDEESSQ
jgi:DNA-binding Xre family transcriptional regulator